MADVLVNHAFVTAKADSPDPTLVSASEWNAAEVFSGGVLGQLVKRDTGSIQGATYIDGPNVHVGGGTYSGASPSPALAAVVLTMATASLVMIAVNANVVLSTGNTYTLVVRRNGATFRTRSARATGEFFCVAVDLAAEAVGTVTFDVVISVGAGTFTSAALELQVLTIGH